MVLSEIQTILTDRPLPLQKGRTRQESAALPVSENDHPDAGMTTETKSAIPVVHQVERKLNEPRISDPVAQEIEALLGISTPKN
jgi:hypothetical protein